MSIELKGATRSYTSYTNSPIELSELRSDVPEEIVQHVGENFSPPRGTRPPEGLGSDEDRTPVLKAIDNPEQHGLAPLSYKPFMLAPWFLNCAFVFNSVILVLLLLFYFVPPSNTRAQWGFFATQVLPVVIGTITVLFLKGMALTLSRLSPFILCATSNGASAGDTILRQYFPGPKLVEAWKKQNFLLLCVWILYLAGNVIVAFKAALINATDEKGLIVTHWALIPLIVIYGLIALVILTVMWTLRGKKLTGLRWDPVSIADHLMLFRHSNVLIYFDGTDLAEKDSMFEALKRLHLRLGYWERENGDIWHGFGLMETEDSRIHTIGNKDPTRKLRAKEIQDVRYRSTCFFMKRMPMTTLVATTFILVGISIAALAAGLSNGIEAYHSYALTSFIFQFIPTFTMGLYTWFWDDISLFICSTQPYINLISPHSASDSLLLDYSFQLPYIVTFSALQNKHWKVARVSAVALLQRLLPILVGSSVVIMNYPEDSIYLPPPHRDPYWIYVSYPQCIIIIIWLLFYAAIIPYEVLEADRKRNLPRNYHSIADILSWTYASRLLRKDDSDEYEKGKLTGNPFNAIKSSEPETDGRWYGGFQSEKWYMEARLRMSGQKYQFGLYESTTHPDRYCMGIDEAGPNMEAVPEPSPSPSTATWRARLTRRKKTVSASVLPTFDETGSGANLKLAGKEYSVSGDKRFVMLLDKNEA